MAFTTKRNWFQSCFIIFYNIPNFKSGGGNRQREENGKEKGTPGCNWPMQVHSENGHPNTVREYIRISPLQRPTAYRSERQTTEDKQLANEATLPLTADQTFSVLSSDPLTILLPQNSRHVITWSSWPLSTCNSNQPSEHLVTEFNSCRHTPTCATTKTYDACVFDTALWWFRM